MADANPAALRAAEVPARRATVYPPRYAGEVAGREKRALGDRFGLSQYGVNLTTLAPGAWSAHRHWHEMEDEFVYVVDGELILVDDGGEHLLTPGMCAGFKAGVANGHHLVNKSGRPASYIEVGTRSANETAHYPEADMEYRKRSGASVIVHKDGSPY